MSINISKKTFGTKCDLVGLPFEKVDFCNV